MGDNSQYNPYGGDPKSPFQTKTLDQIIWWAISNYLMEVHTCLPGKIIKVRDNNEVDVQPLLKQLFMTSKAAESIPAMQNVPVIVPRGTDYWIKLPIAVGDTGLILFSERSLDIWLEQGGEVDPDDVRKFDLSDAMFIPGLYPFDQQLPGDATELTLHNALAEIVMKKSGKFKITNGTNELVDLTEQLTIQTNSLVTQTTALATGVQTFGSANAANPNVIGGGALASSMASVISALNGIASQLSTIQTKLDTLKG